MTQEANKIKEEIGYAWNFVADLGNGKQFSLSGNFPKGVALVDMNAEVDKVRSVFDRQQAKAACRGVADELDQLALRKQAALDDLGRVDERHDKKGGATSEERRQRELAASTIDRMTKDIEFKQGVLKKLEDESK